LALVLLAIALLLTGCDRFYYLTIENHTDQEVIVRVTGHGDYRVRACSIQIDSPLSGPPFEPIEVEVKDTAGNQIYNARVNPEEKGRALPGVYVRIPPEGPGACPTPVSGTYMLNVKNYSRRDASVWLDNVELGSVKALATQTFGPLPGTWETRGKIKILDSEGKSLLFDMWADYDLGQMPQFFAAISSQ